jgi:DNA-binding FadR family transcriptional regulator
MLSGRMLVGFLTQQTGNPIFAEAIHAADLLVKRNLRRTEVILGAVEARGESFRAMRAAMLLGDGDAAERWIRRQYSAMMAQLQQRDPVPLSDAGRSTFSPQKAG